MMRSNVNRNNDNNNDMKKAVRNKENKSKCL